MEVRREQSSGSLDGSRVTIYSRRLENVTNALPDIVEEIKKSVKPGVILDGEVIAVKDGKPMPFQHVLRRFRRKHDVAKMVEKIPLEAHFFDILYHEGECIDLPLKERRKLLESAISESEKIKLAKQIVTDSIDEVRKMYDEAINAGHEGVMIKLPLSPTFRGREARTGLRSRPSWKRSTSLWLGESGEKERGVTG